MADKIKNAAWGVLVAIAIGIGVWNSTRPTPAPIPPDQKKALPAPLPKDTIVAPAGAATVFRLPADVKWDQITWVVPPSQAADFRVIADPDRATLNPRPGKPVAYDFGAVVRIADKTLPIMWWRVVGDESMPIPPPDDDKTPPVPVPPIYTPAKLTVAIVEESGERNKYPHVAKLIASETLRPKLAEKGHTFRVYDKDVGMGATLASRVVAAKVAFPAAVLAESDTGRIREIIACPLDESGVMDSVRKAGGL